MNGQTSLQGWTIIPMPQTMQHKADIALLPMCGRINEARAVGDDRHILAVQLIDDIRAATGLEWDIATGDRWPGFITLTTFDEPHAHPSGAYTLDVTPDGVTVAGADFEGVRNGVQTLRQLIRQCGAALPCLHIEDRPAFETRGYYLDATRGRVPTLDWLKHWADKLCLYKYNQLQLYIEHTFAFDSMSETWRGSSPLTPRDILEFDDYCAERGIELVPSVSTFGHLYMASAKAYDQVIAYLRQLENVDNAKVGIYATSESTWISSYLLQDDPDVAFQILLSPMVFSPRQSLGFFVTQDFTLAGANDGYQSIVQRVFSADTDLFSLTNFDLDTLKPAAYAVPTFVAYGSKDVMTAQVDGVRAILHNAHQANNWDVTVRSYPVANHVLRLGDESEAGTPFADAYVNDLIDWAVGTTAGYTQTSERVAGAGLYQSIGLPGALKARRVGTIYGVIVHVAVVLLLIASTILGLVALGSKIALNAQWRRNRREAKRAGMLLPAKPVVLGFAHGFGGSLLTLTLTTLAAMLIFFAGLGQVIMGVVKLAWGGAPTETPGVMYWSWPVIQVVSVLVVWAWSRVFMRLIEVAWHRGLIQLPPRREAVRNIVTGAEPVLASTRLGRVLFWLVAFTMLNVLLFFAFWGLFVY